jgi:hypothetical protein
MAPWELGKDLHPLTHENRRITPGRAGNRRRATGLEPARAVTGPEPSSGIGRGLLCGSAEDPPVSSYSLRQGHESPEETVMPTRKGFVFAGVATIFGAGFLLGNTVQVVQDAQAASVDRVFELRTYTAPEGKLVNLQARFRDHTLRIFERHGMTNIGYWTPQDAPNSSNTLTYIIAHDSRTAAAASWDAFRSDPEWRRVSEESQVDGRIVSGVVSVFLDPLDFSPIK